MLTREAMHFPSFAGALPDIEANYTVMVINHFIGVIVGSTHLKKMTIFDNLFNLLAYHRAKVWIPPVWLFTYFFQHIHNFKPMDDTQYTHKLYVLH